MTDWHLSAACRGTVPTAAFFPDGPGDKRPAAEVVAVCERCPVSYECLTEALSYSDNDDHGWRAGTSARERREIRRRRRRGVA